MSFVKCVEQLLSCGDLFCDNLSLCGIIFVMPQEWKPLLAFEKGNSCRFILGLELKCKSCINMGLGWDSNFVKTLGNYRKSGMKECHYNQVVTLWNWIQSILIHVNLLELQSIIFIKELE